MSRLTVSELNTQIDNNVTANANNENTGTRVNALLKTLVNNLYVTIDETGDVITIPEYDSGTNYDSGYVIYNDVIYLALQPSGPDNGGAVEPGTDAAVWQAVDSDKFAHPQNSDFRLGRVVGLIDATAAGGLTGTIDLTGTNYKERNYIILNTDAGGNDATYTLQSLNGTESKTGLITLVVPESASYTITFPDNSLQQAGGLELTGGDIAIFECNVNGKTKLIASNKQKLSADNLDTSDFQTLDVDPIVLESGTGASVTDGDFEVDISVDPTGVGEKIVDVAGGNDTISVGGTWDVDRWVGAYIEVQYTSGNDYYEITANDASGNFTVSPNLAEGEIGVTIRFLERIYTDPNEFNDAEAWLILTYNNRTDFARPYKSRHRADVITTDGILTIDDEVELTDSDVDWKLLDVTDISVSGKHESIIACNASDDMYISVPQIATEDNRNKLIIYREGGNDAASDYDVFIFLGDIVLGTNHISLINDYELIELTAHIAGLNHWDFTNSNRLCVCLNTSIVTADTTPLTNTSDETIKATAWDLNHPSRWRVQELSDGSLEYTYLSRIKRTLLITADVEAVRPAGSPEVVITCQVDDGTGYVDYKDRTLDLDASAIVARTFLISRAFNQGDKVRFMSRTDGDGYYIKNFDVKMSEPNA